MSIFTVNQNRDPKVPTTLIPRNESRQKDCLLVGFEELRCVSACAADAPCCSILSRFPIEFETKLVSDAGRRFTNGVGLHRSGRFDCETEEKATCGRPVQR